MSKGPSAEEAPYTKTKPRGWSADAPLRPVASSSPGFEYSETQEDFPVVTDNRRDGDAKSFYSASV